MIENWWVCEVKKWCLVFHLFGMAMHDTIPPASFGAVGVEQAEEWKKLLIMP